MTEISPEPPPADLQPTIRTFPAPSDTNANGDIFGGWLLSQMDIAGGVAASIRAGGRTATVAITAMTFHRPVLVGDEVSCYTHIKRVGRTSITVHIDTWVRRRATGENLKVTEGDFVFVAIDEQGQPRPVPGET